MEDKGKVVWMVEEPSDFEQAVSDSMTNTMLAVLGSSNQNGGAYRFKNLKD